MEIMERPFLFQLMANGEDGKLVPFALGDVEEDLNINTGSVILLSQPMVENIARGAILGPNLAATATDVSCKSRTMFV